MVENHWPKGWLPLGVDCKHGAKKFCFSIPRIKLNRETKNFSRHACNPRLMETSLNSTNFSVKSLKRLQPFNSENSLFYLHLNSFLQDLKDHAFKSIHLRSFFRIKLQILSESRSHLLMTEGWELVLLIAVWGGTLRAVGGLGYILWERVADSGRKS